MSVLQLRMERLVLGLAHRLTRRTRQGRLALEQVAGCDLVILPDVMNPKNFRSGATFARAVRKDLVAPSSFVLDMGAGSGIMSIVAAKQGAQVVAVDINPAAVRCTRINACLNDVEDRIDARQGDLFQAVQDQRFDLILFNPPFFRGKPLAGFDQSWRSEDVVERFADGLAHHLKPQGAALMVLSTDGDTDSFLQAFQERDYGRTVVARRRLLAETFTIYRFEPRCEA